jgi:hypothetical protein
MATDLSPTAREHYRPMPADGQTFPYRRSGELFLTGVPFPALDAARLESDMRGSTHQREAFA